MSSLTISGQDSTPTNAVVHVKMLSTELMHNIWETLRISLDDDDLDHNIIQQQTDVPNVRAQCSVAIQIHHRFEASY